MRLKHWLSRVLVGVALVAACDCHEKTDEERLRERVDTTKVHLWVATKVAVAKAQSDDPDVQKAREQLLAVIAAYNAARSAEPHTAQPDADAGTARLEPGEALELAVALWELRRTGARIVREDSEDELDPVLPILLARFGADAELIGSIDANTEHALLMIALTALKLHPRSPTPIPSEILLYEAMHVDPANLAFPGLGDPTRAARSYLYANEGFCDLAKRDADALDEGETQRLADLFTSLGGKTLLGEDLRRAAGALRGIAHGSTAICYLNREDDANASEELQAFVASAEQGGAAPEDLAMIRAYLAYRDDDLAECRAQLVLAKESSLVDAEGRATIDELVAQLDRDQTSGVDGLFDKAFVAAALVKVSWRELEKAGVFEALADAPVIHAVRDFVNGATGAVGSASESVGQTASEAVESGRSWIERLLGD